MRRREGEIIKRTVGSFDSTLLLHFLGEQKMKDRASAEKHKYSLSHPAGRQDDKLKLKQKLRQYFAAAYFALFDFNQSAPLQHSQEPHRF